jgi:hypothetical protein
VHDWVAKQVDGYRLVRYSSSGSCGTRMRTVRTIRYRCAARAVDLRSALEADEPMCEARGECRLCNCSDWRALAAGVRGPVDWSHGFQFLINCACRPRRSGVQPFAMLYPQKFGLLVFNFSRVRGGNSVVHLLGFFISVSVSTIDRRWLCALNARRM